MKSTSAAILSPVPENAVNEPKGAEIERLPTSAFTPRDGLAYVDVNNLHPVYDKMAFNANVILVGPKGIGKSLSVASWVGKKKCPIVTFDCSEDVRRSHLFGMFVLRGDQTPFILGPIPTAFEIANEVGECVLILEEINALNNQSQKNLNALCDFRKRIEVPEAKRVFKLREGAKLWVVGTMNTAVYGGVYQLNEDLKSRFRLFSLDYPSAGTEKKIISESIPDIKSKMDAKLVDQIVLLAHETRQKSLDYPLSTRDVVQILEDVLFVGIEKALWIASGKFEGEDRATFKARCESIFGVKIA